MSQRCLAPKPGSMLLLIMKWWIWDDRNGGWVTHISDHFHMWIKIVATCSHRHRQILVIWKPTLGYPIWPMIFYSCRSFHVGVWRLIIPRFIAIKQKLKWIKMRLQSIASCFFPQHVQTFVHMKIIWHHNIWRQASPPCWKCPRAWRWSVPHLRGQSCWALQLKCCRISSCADTAGNKYVMYDIVSS